MSQGIQRSKKVFKLVTSENIDVACIKEVLGKYELYDIEVTLEEEEPIDYSHVEIGHQVRISIPRRFVRFLSDKAYYNEEMDKYFGINPRLGRTSFEYEGRQYEISMRLYITKLKPVLMVDICVKSDVERSIWHQLDTVRITEWKEENSCFFMVEDKRIVVEFFEEFNSDWDEHL